jgi:hypothetical protein
VLGKAPSFRMDENGTLWFRKGYVYLKWRPFVRQFYEKHMSQLTPYTLEVLRCTWISKRNIGGMD